MWLVVKIMVHFWESILIEGDIDIDVDTDTDS